MRRPFDRLGARRERSPGVFPESRRPSFGRVVAIDHFRGLFAAAASGGGVLPAPSGRLEGELDRGALVPIAPAIRPLEYRYTLTGIRTGAGVGHARKRGGSPATGH